MWFRRTPTACGLRAQVRASVVYVPEQSPSGKHLFAYSIGFSLLPTEEQAAHWPATAGLPHAVLRCQLMTRHWVIRDGAGHQVDEVCVRVWRGGHLGLGG